jgi:GNAT superfamily N-acetyltransferase
VSAPELVIAFDPAPEFLAPIGVGLRAYNDARAGANPRRVVALRAEAAGRVLGGAYGWFHFGWLYTDWLWVEEGARGQGLGSAMLLRLETLASEAGIRRARLNTASFQAPAFYLKLGYREFAQLPCTGADGREHTDYFLRKDL